MNDSIYRSALREKQPHNVWTKAAIIQGIRFDISVSPELLNKIEKKCLINFTSTFISLQNIK